MNVALIGLRGSGKSTVGRILADRLECDFFDTDKLVQERVDMTIREIFEKMGEAKFREMESVLVQACAAGDGAIIATGGGAILDPENVAALRRSCFVVHLTADPAELWHRIVQHKDSYDSRPPLIPGADSGIDELKKLMLARAGAYAAARHAEVDVEDRSPDEVADAILLLIRAHGLKAPTTKV